MNGSGPADPSDFLENDTYFEADAVPFEGAGYRAQGVAPMPVAQDSKYYNMSHAKRGKAIVFSHKTFLNEHASREGAEKDEELLKLCLEPLGFEVMFCRDLTFSEIEDARNDLLLDEDNRNVDCLLIIVLSRGEGNKIYSSNQKYLPENLWDPFEASACPFLAGKPKIFLIQASNPNQISSKVPPLVRRTETDSAPNPTNSDESYVVPNRADFLIVYSRAPDPPEGSWFVKALHDVLQTYSGDKDLLSMMTLIAQQVADRYKSLPTGSNLKEKIPKISSTLVREIKFNIPHDKLIIDSPKKQQSNSEELVLETEHTRELLARLGSSDTIDLPGKYNMQRGKRGLALIFNQVNYLNGRVRDGTVEDKDRLSTCLESLGYKVEVYPDLEAKEIQVVLQSTSKLDHSDSDSLIVVVLSHGDQNLITCSRSSYKPEVLWKSFTADACPLLIGKPKIFFIQACRGTQTDSGIKLINPTNPENGVFPLGQGFQISPDKSRSYLVPNEADFLIAYASAPGYYSYRDTLKGAWFVQALTKVLSERSKDTDLLSIMTLVAHKVAFFKDPNSTDDKQPRQIPMTSSTLIGKVYFPENDTPATAVPENKDSNWCRSS